MCNPSSGIEGSSSFEEEALQNNYAKEKKI
jgi:hypothetical protein